MRCKPSCGRTTWSTSLCGVITATTTATAATARRRSNASNAQLRHINAQLPHLRTLSAASYADASSRTSTRSSTTHVEREALQVSKEFGKPFAIITTARRFVKTSQSQAPSLSQESGTLLRCSIPLLTALLPTELLLIAAAPLVGKSGRVCSRRRCRSTRRQPSHRAAFRGFCRCRYPRLVPCWPEERRPRTPHR